MHLTRQGSISAHIFIYELLQSQGLNAHCKAANNAVEDANDLLVVAEQVHFGHIDRPEDEYLVVESEDKDALDTVQEEVDCELGASRAFSFLFEQLVDELQHFDRDAQSHKENRESNPIRVKHPPYLLPLKYL